jgi:uncharacterized membrane protein YbaN (DUF454 family)
VKLLWNIIGATALLLGVIGVVLPLLPTTPFVILAAFAFAKSHPAMRQWLVDHARFGPMIRDWEANGAIAPKFKALAVLMMLAAFGLSLALGINAKVLIIQAIVLSGAALFILSRPSGAA